MRAGAVALAAVLCAGGLAAQAQQARLAAQALLHEKAPGFVRTDLAGKRLDLKAYGGKVVLLNFWATWCGPCKLELPQFAEWQRQYGAKGFQVIAVSMDDDAGPVRRYLRTLKPGFPVLMGDERLGRAYGGVLGLPVTFLIGRDGRIAARIEGGADLPAMERQVKGLLAQH